MDDFTALGTIRRAWIKGRCIGTASVGGEYADIYALGWVSHLRTALAEIAVSLGMEDVDLSSLERAEPRLLTQHAGRNAFELGYAGVCYHSRFGHSIENWAISERFPIHQPNSRKVAEDGGRGPGHQTRRKTMLYLTPMHAAKTALMLLIANIRAALSHVTKVAEQFPATDRWKTFLD